MALHYFVKVIVKSTENKLIIIIIIIIIIKIIILIIIIIIIINIAMNSIVNVTGVSVYSCSYHVPLVTVKISNP